MGGFLIQSRVPRHEIWEWLDFSWRLHQPNAFQGPNNLRQYSRQSQYQIRVCKCENCGREKWNSKDNTAFRAKPSQRMVYWSLLARPRFDYNMRELQILSQCKAAGMKSLRSPDHADKIH